MIKTLVAIHCHHGVEDVIDRHEHLWAAHGHDYVFVCPEDNPIHGRPHISIGKQGHSGPDSINRFRDTWRALWRLGNDCAYDRYAIFEYDSFCLDSELPDLPGMAGNRLCEDHLSSQFRSRFYFHAPWIMSASILGGINTTMQFMAPTCEGSFFDRFLGRALEMHSIPASSFGALGFTGQNEIGPKDYQALADAILKGAVAIHGVKTEECLQVALTNRENYMRSKLAR